MKKKLTLLFTALIFVCVFSGCGGEDDGRNGQFNVTLSENPYNLDPQTAESKASAFVIKNIYGTLMDIDSRGMVVCGTAESYSVSSDGLEYNFVLRDGLCWYGLSSEDERLPLTAYDYEYAFKRIYDPATQSPHTERFECIKNSMSLYNGEADGGSFGVKANDSRSLTITLNDPNCEFLKLLAHSAASPCNERLFLSTQGRYGLSAADTYACGAFYVSDWNYDPYWNDNHITLEKIKYNSVEGYETFPQSVNIRISESSEKSQNTKNAVIHAYTVNSISQYDENIRSSYAYDEYIYGVTCLVASPAHSLNDDVRSSVMNAVDMERIYAELNENSVPAAGLFPNAVTIMNKSFRELYPEERIAAGKVSSDLLSANVSAELNNSILLASDSLNSKSHIYNAAADFYENMNFDCVTEFEPDNIFNEKISAGEYDFCIVTAAPDYNLTEDLIAELEKYTALYDDSHTDELSERIEKLSKCAELSEKMTCAKDIENYLIDNDFLIPLSFEKKYLIHHKNVSDLWYDPFTDVMYFKYAKLF